MDIGFANHFSEKFVQIQFPQHLEADSASQYVVISNKKLTNTLRDALPEAVAPPYGREYRVVSNEFTDQITATALVSRRPVFRALAAHKRLSPPLRVPTLLSRSPRILL